MSERLRTGSESPDSTPSDSEDLTVAGREVWSAPRLRRSGVSEETLAGIPNVTEGATVGS